VGGWAYKEASGRNGWANGKVRRWDKKESEESATECGTGETNAGGWQGEQVKKNKGIIHSPTYLSISASCFSYTLPLSRD
jgi:hypothetical protein